MSGLAARAGQLRGDEWVPWITVVALLATVPWFLAHGELEWALLTLLLVGVALVPSIHAQDVTVTFPAELLVLIAIPVLIRAAGWFPQGTPFLVVAGIALLGAIALEAYTSLALTPRFAVVFTVVTTMAFAASWTVGTWAADQFLGTTFLVDKTELMWDLIVATSMGIVAGVVFELYLQRTDRLRHLRDGGADPTGSRIEPSANRRVSESGPGYPLAIRGMQAVLGVIVAYAVVSLDGPLFVNSAIPLAVTFLPALFRHEYGYSMDRSLAVWVTIAASLHAIGSVGPYQMFGWYDSVTHSVSGGLVAIVAYAIARAAENHSEEVTFDPAFRVAFVFLFVLAVGIAWEILEFGSGAVSGLLGGEAVLAQYGTSDIVYDLLYNAIGAVAVTVWSTGRFDDVSRVLAGPVQHLVGRE